MKTNKRQVVVVLLAVVLGMVAGKIFLGGGMDHAPSGQAAGVGNIKFWTCSMHPQIRQAGPGKCPICGMDLIPVGDNADGASLGPSELKLSPRAEKLAEIQVVPVVRKFVNTRIRMVGKVEYDETRVGNITAWVPGRLDKLYVDYTGVQVHKGDHMVYMYSPDLLSAQEELIQAAKATESLKNSQIPLVRERTESTLKSSREKLKLLGLTDEQIQKIETSGQPEDHMTIYSPMSGIVIQKNALEGMYVQTGSKIYTIADLSKVWVKLDAYESDLAWLHYGQQVEFATEAFPGEVFIGRISFIDPVLDPATRTVKVRVNVDNASQKLKPEMFVRGTIQARVAKQGRLFSPDMIGKWISPMHPEIIKDGPGKCDICGMDLVSVESLGFKAPEDEDPPLIIPASAPLVTGRRAVVYVKDPERKGVYAGREIVLGPRAGDYYVVNSGIEEGEQVVFNGNFKLDSAVQILAKPSMMAPGEKVAPLATIQAPDDFKTQFVRVVKAYYAIQKGLARDEVMPEAAKGLAAALDEVDMSLLGEAGHMVWMKQLKRIKEAAEQVASSTQIAESRKHFGSLSAAMIEAVKQFGLPPDSTTHVAHCPMAFDNQGASWLQPAKEVLNPYFGSAMLHCGDIEETLGLPAPVPEREKAAPDGAPSPKADHSDHKHHHQEGVHGPGQ